MSKMSTHNMPKATSVPTGSKFPEGVTGNFDLKPGFLNLIERNQFGGAANEDPAKHIRNFCDYCSTIQHVNISQDKLREMYFRFSLKDEAREWISDLDMEAAGITDWNSLALAFYQKYFPPEKTNMLRSQITSFKQHGTEDLSEAWERFKKLVKSVPHHEFETWFLVLQFHNGLFDESRAILDSAAGGRFASNVNDTEAWQIVEDMALHTRQYGRPRSTLKRDMRETNNINSIGDQIATAVAAEMASLHLRLDQMQSTSSSAVQPVHAMVQEEACDGCGLFGHFASECQAPQESVNYFQDWREKNSPWLNHPGYNKANGSYRSQNVLNPTTPPPQQPPQPSNSYIPPHRAAPSHNSYQKQPYYLKPDQPPIPHNNYQPNQSQPPPSQPNSEMAELKALLQQSITKHDAQISQILAHNKQMDTKLHQLAASSSTRQPGMFPSVGKSPHEQANAITLRSGTNYQGPKMPDSVDNTGVDKLDDWVEVTVESEDNAEVVGNS